MPRLHRVHDLGTRHLVYFEIDRRVVPVKSSEDLRKPRRRRRHVGVQPDGAGPTTTRCVQIRRDEVEQLEHARQLLGEVPTGGRQRHAAFVPLGQRDAALAPPTRRPYG